VGTLTMHKYQVRLFF